MNLWDALPFLLLVFLCGHAVFIASFLILRNNKRDARLLGILLSLLLMRVAKSVVALTFPETSLASGVVGVVSMACVGPVLTLYIQSLFHVKIIDAKQFLIHLSPACLFALFWSWKFLNVAYYLSTLQLLIYLILVSRYLVVNKEIFKSDNLRWRWAVMVTLSLLILWVTFALQLFVYDRLLYIIIVSVSIIITYSLTLWIATQQKPFVGKKAVLETETEESILLYEKITVLMKEEIFMEPSLNLSSLAKRLNKPPYLVSRVINEKFDKTFPELLTSYRLNKAVDLLLSSDNKKYTIEAIAYESGFSTLSSFYTVFKKEKGMSPAEFRKKNLQREARNL
jgi:AraC-like DNA-binding protein